MTSDKKSWTQHDTSSAVGTGDVSKVIHGLPGCFRFPSPSGPHFHNQNHGPVGTVPFRAERERLRSLAAYMRSLNPGKGELEIFIHNWARMMERIALEMEAFGDELLAHHVRLGDPDTSDTPRPR